jgi:hypothetical protein
MADFVQVGAGWTKESKKDGSKFVSIAMKMGGKNVTLFLFKNKYKKSDTHPDYLVNMDKDLASHADVEVKMDPKGDKRSSYASKNRVSPQERSEPIEVKEEVAVPSAPAEDDGEPF